MDFTGNTKYSGFSADLRLVSASGEDAARRAMPTSRVGARSGETAAAIRSGPVERLWGPPWVPDAGGQSVVTGFESLPGWSSAGARLWTTCVGPVSGQSGKSLTAVVDTARRRKENVGAD